LSPEEISGAGLQDARRVPTKNAPITPNAFRAKVGNDALCVVVEGQPCGDLSDSRIFSRLSILAPLAGGMISYYITKRDCTLRALQS